MNKIMFINGPNLNLLGMREPNNYGNTSLSSLNDSLIKLSREKGFYSEFYQSNCEGELITKIQSLDHNFLIINPASLSHTSIGLRDAILAINIPLIEIHISNIYKREKFRQYSYISDISIGVISGLGVKGYKLALLYAIDYLLIKR